MTILGSRTLLLVMLMLLPHGNSVRGASESDKFLNVVERNWLQRHKQDLRALIEVTNPPNSFINADGLHDGLFIDYLKEIKNHIGFEIEIESFNNWPALLETSKQRNKFIIIGIAKTELRTGYLLFTDKFISIPYVLVTKDNSQKRSLATLADNTLCTVQDYSVNNYLDTNFPNIKYREVINTLAGLNKLGTSCDFMISNQMQLSYLIEQHDLSGLSIVGNTDYSVDLAIAVSNRDPVFRQILSKTLTKIGNERRLELTRHWINPSKHNFIQEALFIAAGLCLLIVFLLWLWTTSLRREINRSLTKTRHTEKEFGNFQMAKVRFRKLP